MLRIGLGLIGATLLTIMLSTADVRQGIQDVFHSVTRLTYPPIRDMRQKVALIPQRSLAAVRLPDSLAVPTSGREIVLDRETLARTLRNPVAADDSSLARGERKYGRLCTPCHGASLKGDGPVSKEFMPPPDLLGATVRERSDGYLWSTIRHGGAVMPSYGAQATAEETWDLVNYLRHKQRTEPR